MTQATARATDQRLLELRALALGRRIDGSDAEQLRQEVAGVIEELIALRRQFAKLRQQFDQHREDTGKDAHRLIREKMSALEQLAEMHGAARELIDANERWGMTMRRRKAVERYNAALAPTSQPSREKP